jgi:hypothetical protein
MICHRRLFKAVWLSLRISPLKHFDDPRRSAAMPFPAIPHRINPGTKRAPLQRIILISTGRGTRILLPGSPLMQCNIAIPWQFRLLCHPVFAFKSVDWCEVKCAF